MELRKLNAELKAKELVDFYLPKVYCYVGSGFMTGTEDEDYKLKLAKECSIFLLNQIEEFSLELPYDFIEEVKQEINKLNLH
jgi:hypothetical protein